MSQTTTEAYVARIAALLDKAESTPFEAEAEAFLAKAQELMARHAIDEAMLEDARPASDAIAHDGLLIVAPYSSAKSSLLGAVARANRCRVVVERRPNGRTYCTIVGHQTDLANVRMLFTSLSFQAVRFMLDAPVPAHDTPRRFRHAFLLAYAARIGQRLLDAERLATAEAEADQARQPAGRSVSLVLASREQAVDRALHESFPGLRTRRTTASSAAGYASGAAAANRASLDHRPLASGGRRLPAG